VRLQAVQKSESDEYCLLMTLQHSAIHLKT
jgi:hypothetical protein